MIYDIVELYLNDELVKKFELAYSHRPLLEQISFFLSSNIKRFITPKDFSSWGSSAKFYLTWNGERFNIESFLTGSHYVKALPVLNTWDHLVELKKKYSVSGPFISGTEFGPGEELTLVYSSEGHYWVE